MATNSQDWQRQHAATILEPCGGDRRLALPCRRRGTPCESQASMKTGTPQRTIVEYTGRVQGVGFRYTARSIARRYEVGGYVRNRPDGSVELVVEGNPPEVDGFLREVRDRFSGHIRKELSDIQPATGEFSGFEVRY